MKKIMVVGPKALSNEVVRVLQDLGTVHLTQTEGLEKLAWDGTSSETLSRQEKLLSKLDTLISILSPLRLNASQASLSSSNHEEWINHLSEKCSELVQRKQNLTDEFSILEAYQGTFKNLIPLLQPLEGSQHFEALGSIVGKMEKKKIEALEKEIETLSPGKILIFKRELDGETLGVVLAYPKSQAGLIRSLLNRFGLNELKVPSSLSSYPLQEAVIKMEEKLKEIPKTLQQIEETLREIANQNFHALKLYQAQLEDETTVHKAMKDLGQTQKAFIIKGYNPAKSISKLEKMLNERFKGSIHLEVQDCHEAPVLLDNYRFFKPFELFIKVLRPPKYSSIDPTPYFALFFPIFFGMIMGDIGYGLVFFILGLILRLKTTQELLKHVGEIILISSTYTILFGIVFGECFGDWLEKKEIIHPLRMHLGSTEIVWDRLHSLVPLLILAIAVGVFHVTLGFVLKLIQSIKHRHHHEVIEVIAILISLASLFTLIGVLAHQVPTLAKIPSVILLLIAVPLLIFMKGPMMLMELLSFVGNMLSYARLMAVGVASAYLAFVGNMLGGIVGNVILGAIIAILFHIINMVLAFSPTIQSARLHYVEFFTKFYDSGGRLYQPLSKKRVQV
ncbi:MAG: hypothetical protein HYS07_07085 [Chlamydiae bacterium]|nr:hypothetical protein [Chlamydiota bacterium]MBI3276907.1 hypothetical protein [Chlamydiota bacterium]